MPDPRPEGFHFNKDGTVTVVIEDEDPRKLKRPRTGAYKAYLLASRARDDELNELRDQAQRETSPPAGKALDDLPADERDALIETARNRNREITDRQGELDRDWFRLVFNGDGQTLQPLSDRPLPDDDDDWPVWLWQADHLRELLEHWRTAPLALGKQ